MDGYKASNEATPRTSDFHSGIVPLKHSKIQFGAGKTK